MAKKITFLGIETSCDETAAAVIRENDKGTADILSNIVSSQIEEHKKFGGVVPELAARAHLENIEYIIDTALKESKISIDEIDGVAATAGPGLIVCLTVGLNIGKSIAAFSNKPFIGVNHLEGHALSPGLEKKIKFPYLLLLPIISVCAFMLDGFFVGAAKSKPMRNSTLLAFCVFIILNYFIMLINPNIQYLWLSYLIFLLLRGVFLSFYFNSLFVYDN